jgi:hypothetical protein
MVELVDTRDLKSLGNYRPCGFDSHFGYQKKEYMARKKYTNNQKKQIRRSSKYKQKQIGQDSKKKRKS